MKKCNRLQLYYALFSLMVENSRITPNQMASRLQYSGRGRSPSTLVRHINNMYKRHISMKPRLVLKPFENCKTTTYFCRKNQSSETKKTFDSLRADHRITYIVMLSGRTFFLTSRVDNLEFNDLGLEILEKSTLYTPIYVIPRGWNLPMNEALGNFARSDFRKGTIRRELYGSLNWSELDWNIYNISRSDARVKISIIKRRTEVSYNTIKKHFYDNVLPSCVIAHYFFPEGYPSYQQLVLKLSSKYEKGIVDGLRKLPCTSYVFPLENGLFVALFHEDTDFTMDTIQKLEERAIIDDCLLFNPLTYYIPD